MPRIRSVHPEICDSEELAQISAAAERTYVRLWTHLDDEGRIADRPKVLAARLYPVHDDVGPAEVDHDLEELATAGLVIRYQVDGAAYLAVRGSWDRWQRPQNPKPSAIPPPPGSAVDPVAQMTGNTIRARRKAAGLSLRALAEQLDIDHSYLSRAERGQSVLSVELRQKLVQLLPKAVDNRGDRGDSTEVTTGHQASYPQEDGPRVVTKGDHLVSSGDSPTVTSENGQLPPPTDPSTTPDADTAADVVSSGDHLVTDGDTERELEWERELNPPRAHASEPPAPDGSTTDDGGGRTDQEQPNPDLAYQQAVIGRLPDRIRRRLAAEGPRALGRLHRALRDARLAGIRIGAIRDALNAAPALDAGTKSIAAVATTRIRNLIGQEPASA